MARNEVYRWRRNSKTRPFGNVRQLKSGKWQARYSVLGKTYTAPITYATEKQAETYLTLT